MARSRSVRSEDSHRARIVLALAKEASLRKLSVQEQCAIILSDCGRCASPPNDSWNSTGGIVEENLEPEATDFTRAL